MERVGLRICSPLRRAKALMEGIATWSKSSIVRIHELASTDEYWRAEKVLLWTAMKEVLRSRCLLGEAFPPRMDREGVADGSTTRTRRAHHHSSLFPPTSSISSSPAFRPKRHVTMLSPASAPRRANLSVSREPAPLMIEPL